MKDRVCFMCTTPYQVFTSINIVENQGFDADIYIVSQFKNYIELAESLRKENCFKNVLVVEEEKYIKRNKNKLMNYINILYVYSMTSNIVNDFFLFQRNYSKLFVSSKFLIGRLVCLYYLKRKINIEFNYFEDGIGTYCNDNLFQIHWYDKICQKIFFGNYIDKLQFNQYVYNLNLYKHMHNNNVLKLFKIDIMNQNHSNINQINKIFNVHQDMILEKYIYFDAIRLEELNEDGIRLLDDIINVIMQVIGKDNIIFKSHPREKKRSDKIRYMKNDNVPFEVLLFSYSFLDKVLITNMSSAVFTPKLLYGYEPPIIFLNYLLKDVMRDKSNITNLVDEFKDMYRFNVIYVPKTKEELLKVLEELKLKKRVGRNE